VNPSAILYESFQKGPRNTKSFFWRCDVIYNQGIFTLRTIESIWLHRLAYKSCSQMIFPSLNFFVEKGLSTLVQKTLVERATYINYMLVCNMHLWPLDVKRCTWYICYCCEFSRWWPIAKTCHQWLVWTIYTSGVAMACKLQQFLDNFFLAQKVVAYVKDDGSNLQTCTTILNLIVSYNMLGMFESFDGSYFGHVLSKVG